MNYSSDIGFKDYGALQKIHGKPHCCLVNDTIHISDNPLTSRKNLIK